MNSRTQFHRLLGKFYNLQNTQGLGTACVSIYALEMMCGVDGESFSFTDEINELMAAGKVSVKISTTGVPIADCTQVDPFDHLNFIFLQEWQANDS